MVCHTRIHLAMHYVLCQLVYPIEKNIQLKQNIWQCKVSIMQTLMVMPPHPMRKIPQNVTLMK